MDLRGSDTRTDAEASSEFRFFESTINGIVWMSLCSLFYALFFAYGPMVVGTVVKTVGITSLPPQVLIFGVPFVLAFMLWPAVSVAIFFWNYLPKVAKALDRPALNKIDIPDWLGAALVFGFFGGLLVFMVVLAGAAFFQTWLALGEPTLSIFDWFDRVADFLN